MFLKYFTPKLIPKQTKQRIVKEEHFGKKNLLERKTDEEIQRIIITSNDYFDQISKIDDEDPFLIGIYSFLIENIQYAPIPNNQCQRLIEQQAFSIQNVKVAKVAMQYLSYYVYGNFELELKILNNIDINLLQFYFSSETVIDDDLFQFLKIFLNFSPNIARFCLDNEIYEQLLQISGIFYDDQLFQRLSLIKTAISTFNSLENCNDLYEKVIFNLADVVGNVNHRIDSQELICYCISHCLLKIADVDNSCFSCLFDDKCCFDWILTYWEADLTEINDQTISINFNISNIIFIICYYDSAKLKRAHISKWIRNKFMFISENEQEEEIYRKYHTKIDLTNIYLIGALIYILHDNPYNISDLVYNESEADPSFLDYLFDLLVNGNSQMKNISVEFFWKLCHIENQSTITNFIYPYFINHNVIEKTIEYYEELDGIPLKYVLSEILLKVNSISQDFDDHPIVIQIRTEENFQIFQRISSQNSDEEIRDLAIAILEKVFATSDNE